mmetsp:Transcript_42345/g.77337  ORF Transcript_42345/g.77337 Transcript_42345/m.77337 type:complete len:201 (-) Transcript_42345:1312-1914(-)
MAKVRSALSMRHSLRSSPCVPVRTLATGRLISPPNSLTAVVESGEGPPLLGSERVGLVTAERSLAALAQPFLERSREVLRSMMRSMQKGLSSSNFCVANSCTMSSHAGGFSAAMIPWAAEISSSGAEMPPASRTHFIRRISALSNTSRLRSSTAHAPYCRSMLAASALSSRTARFKALSPLEFVWPTSAPRSSSIFRRST